jgi:PEGA domain
MPGRSITLVAATALILCVTAGYASANGAILVLGKPSAERHQLIVDTVIKVGGEVGWSLNAPVFSSADGDAITACLADDHPWKCIAPKMRDKGDRLIVVQIELERSDTVVTVHVVSAATGVDATSRHFCNACDERALAQAITDVTKELLHDSSVRSGTTLLAIKSIPDKAWISLDGKPAGATNATKATYPGEHVVVLRQDGYEPATQTVTAIDGKVVNVEIALEPAKGLPRTQTQLYPAETTSQLLPKVMIGAGGVAVVTGVLMIAFDQDPDAAGRQKERIYNTAPAGTAIAIGGALLVGAGVYLWRHNTKASAAAVVPIAGGGAAVSWSGRF